jgi:hypothetical protein
MPQMLTDIMTNPNLRGARAEWLAGAIACDILRRCNVDELPRILAAVGEWRGDVLAAIRQHFPQYCREAANA